MKFMDSLPTVISCCFCCFLRAGSVMIGLVSFMAGLILAPNVSHTHRYLTDAVFSKDAIFESVIQITLGGISILLCIVSVCLIIGSLCNVPKLILVYQWGALVYSTVIFFLFLSLTIYCLAIKGNCVVAATTLVLFMVVNVLLTSYFIIVVNSLRMSLQYLANSRITI